MSETDTKEAPKQATVMGLGWVVLWGFVTSCAALFLAIWYFAAQATVTSDAWQWIPPLDQQEMFEVVRNGITAVAALGVGVTLFLSYRRQHVAERALELSAEAQTQASKTLDLSSRTYELTRQQHAAEYENQLRTRYSAAAQQIGDSNASLAIAGCISMATIADEWDRLKRFADRDDCIRMLVAALPEGSWDDSGNHLRRATIGAIFQERMVGTNGDRAGWTSADIDFGTTRAPFGKIVGWNISGAVKIQSAQLSLTKSTAVIQKTTVKRGLLKVSMNSPEQDYLLFPMLTLIHADLFVDFPFLPAEEEPSRVVFRDSSFKGSRLRFEEANSPCFPRTIVFERCTFNGRAIKVPRSSSAYRFVFTKCTFTDNPFAAVNRTRSPNVAIELNEGNTFKDAMSDFPADDPYALLDTSSWFFPKGKTSRSGKEANAN